MSLKTKILKYFRNIIAERIYKKILKGIFNHCGWNENNRAT